MSSENVSDKLKVLLTSAGVYDEVSAKWETLSGIVKETKKSSHMDQGTVIYRLAMTVYHSKPLTGSPIISAMEDPAAIYLKIQSRDPELARMIQEESKKIPTTAIMEIVKTLIAFLVAAYVSHRVENESSTTSTAT